MKKYLLDIYNLLDGSRSIYNCWLHPSPPPNRMNGRSMGTIQRHFAWEGSSGKQSLTVNIGIVALIIEDQLIEEQKEGYVKESWHLSHLCGNWTCCNWRHMTVESGPVNNSRNMCFKSDSRCQHDPPCMKRRKRQFPVTLDIYRQINKAMRSTEQKMVISNATFDCRICRNGEKTDGICHCLTSIKKSHQALERLEPYEWSSVKVSKAIDHLSQIIKDLLREKEASDAAMLQRTVARREVRRSAYWSQEQFSPYGKMLGVLLDWDCV